MFMLLTPQPRSPQVLEDSSCSSTARMQSGALPLPLPLLALVVAALGLLGACGTAAAAGPYSGHAVLRVVPASTEQLEALHDHLREHDMVRASRLFMAGKMMNAPTRQNKHNAV